MNSQIETIIQCISRKVKDDDFLEFLEMKCEYLEPLDLSGESIEPLLRIFEENPDIDFGMPGPLVHFLERFYKKGYEEKLITSIERKPTSHTLWMLNRLINGSYGKIKEDLINKLDDVLQRTDIDLKTKNTAQEFRNLHQ